MYYEIAQRKGLSILQLYNRIAWLAREHLAIVGTGQDVGDKMETWVDEERADSVTSRPLTYPWYR
jgi:alkanesulfonate monooxygenase SsuD/methylene tetrahydromethanopterin reductase-like flavin-dependent oxidoreductase (luciferase family)